MKSENGSITLFVLISMIFFLIISTTAYVSAMSKLQGQNAEVEQIKAAYEQDLSDESLLKLYNKATRTREWLQGSGTQEDTYKIYTIEDLVELSNRTNDATNPKTFEGQYVELMNDLDFQKDSSYAKADRTDFGDVNGDGTVEALKTELTTGNGFMPIGKTSELAFKGTFDGNNYTISHLRVERNAKYVGLFGNSITIQNLTIKDSYIKGNECVGGIIGIAKKTVFNCKNVNTYVAGQQVVGRNCWSCD